VGYRQAAPEKERAGTLGRQAAPKEEQAGL